MTRWSSGGVAAEDAVDVLAALLALADRRADDGERADRLVEVELAVVEAAQDGGAAPGASSSSRSARRGRGPREEEPLRVADAELRERLELLPGLDALGDERRVDGRRERDERLHEVLLVGVPVDVARQRHVELEVVRRAGHERQQPRVPGAEVVERDLEALVDELAQVALEGGVVRDRLALGDLEDEVGLLEALALAARRRRGGRADAGRRGPTG